MIIAKRATSEAARIYDDLATKRIPQYRFAVRNGFGDLGHLGAIRGRQINLRRALNAVRRHCKILPRQFSKWERLANRDFPKLH